MSPDYQHLYGPIPSRRFGRSLGVDLTPLKTCCQDCIFCQLGPTTNKCLHQDECVPTEAVLHELSQWRKSGDRARHILLSGSGEPTLHTDFGIILEQIRSMAKAPAVLMTNGALLWMDDVRDAACRADIVKVSLSAWNPKMYERINRPHEGLDFECILAGIQRFRQEYSGRLWLEVFLIKNLNDAPDDVAGIATLADQVRPDRIHLNTVCRPPAAPYILPVTEREMRTLAPLFHPRAEIIGEYADKSGVTLHISEDSIVSMLGRRPGTPGQIAGAFGADTNEVVKLLAKLIRGGRIKVRAENGRTFLVRLAANDRGPVLSAGEVPAFQGEKA